MKNLFVHIILILQTSFAFGQLISFAPAGAQWYYDFSPTGCACNGYVKINFLKDTTINNTKCKLLTITRVVYNEMLEELTTEELNTEFITEDTGKISVFRFGKFQTLFDFTSDVGAIWKIPANPSYLTECDSFGYVIIDSIINIEINGHSFKSFYTSPYNGSNWIFNSTVIEKLGGIDYLFPEPYNCAADADDGTGLRCYSDDEFGYYQVTNSPCDEIITGMANYKTEDNEYLLINNISSETIYIKKLKDRGYSFSNVEIVVVDVNGKVLYCQNSNLINTISIKIDQLYEGFYFLKLTTPTTYKIFKFLKS